VTEIRPAEICVAKVHIAELRLAKERRVVVRPAEIRLAEVWTNGRLISQCVPNLAAFPEEVEMLWLAIARPYLSLNPPAAAIMAWRAGLPSP
jgi:hypothetical protein